jgi:DNA polymerase-3 subunit delta'
MCARCRRGAHPAYWEFAPVGAFHRVADVREQWVRTAFRTGAEGSWKVLRILDADRMNEAAANAFLKALEEPPPSTVWILDVADPDELPDTILSRCRSVRFRPWGARELEEEAAALGLSEPVDRRLAVRASSGSPVRLRRLAASGGLDDLRAHRDIAGALRRRGAGEALVAARRLDEEAKRHSAELKAAGRSELAELAALYGEQVPRAVGKAVEERLGREEREARVHAVQSALDDLVAWYRDCLLVAAGGHPGEAVHADAAEQLVQDAATLSPEAVLRAIDLILAAREDLELNVQQGLTLEALFIQVAALSRA